MSSSDNSTNVVGLSSSLSSSSAKPNRLFNPPSMMEWRNMRFMVMDAPSDANLDLYLREMHREHVRWCVRVCEPTYRKATLEGQGIAVYDWVFPDGDAPPDSVISDWLALVNKVQSLENGGGGKRPCIATHCVAGLGRAPVLVAIALIEAGMSPLDAVTFIRERRRGAINSKQLRFLEHYKRRSRRPEKCLIT